VTLLIRRGETRKEERYIDLRLKGLLNQFERVGDSIKMGGRGQRMWKKRNQFPEEISEGGSTITKVEAALLTCASVDPGRKQ